MLVTRASGLAMEALVEPADLKPLEWITGEAVSQRTKADLPFLH
jgi:hypothetical protein